MLFSHSEIEALAARLADHNAPVVYQDMLDAARALTMLLATNATLHRALATQAKTHDARVTELLHANNAELERRRAAEAEVARLVEAPATINQTIQSHGCVCPAGAERSCGAMLCPRRGAPGLSQIRMTINDARVFVAKGGDNAG